MNILKELPELVNAGIISKETASNIKEFYQVKNVNPQNKLYIITGILGAILAGLGIILIIAHNWDGLSRFTKTIIAFLPLVAGQILCGFALIKKTGNTAWRESASPFLFFAVGASLSLVSQVYNIPGDLGPFILIWMLLCIPLVYVMNSSVVSLLYIIGITFYAGETNYGSNSGNHYYWLLLLLVLPHYYLLYKKKSVSNFMTFHNWIVPLSIIISLGTVSRNNTELMFVAYISLFALFYIIGHLPFFYKQKPTRHGFVTFGSIGTIVLLLGLSFNWFWSDLRAESYQFNNIILSPELIVTAIISFLALYLLFLKIRQNSIKDVKPIDLAFIVFAIIFIIGLVSPIAVILVNLLVFVIGISTIRDGTKNDHMGIMNFGLLIITSLVICRLFDTDLSFVLRGFLFLGVGIGFFFLNYFMIKKRKVNA